MKGPSFSIVGRCWDWMRSQKSKQYMNETVGLTERNRWHGDYKDQISVDYLGVL